MARKAYTPEQIIKIQITGGGRTQAAKAASYYGLTMKVSADGPISIFVNGIEIIRFEY